MKDEKRTYFYFPTEVILSGEWGSKEAKGMRRLMPTLHMFEWGNGWCNPCYDMLSEMCGVTKKSVATYSKNVNVFEKFGYSRKTYTSKKCGRDGWAYDVPNLSKKKVKKLIIWRDIIDNDKWRNLKPSSQSIYFCLRALSKTDESSMDEDGEMSLRYKQRNSDVVKSVVMKNLSKMSGVSRSKIEMCFEELMEVRLIDTCGKGFSIAVWNYGSF